MAKKFRPGGDTSDDAPDADIVFAYKVGTGCPYCGRVPKDGESAEGWMNWVPKDANGELDYGAAQLICPECWQKHGFGQGSGTAE